MYFARKIKSEIKFWTFVLTCYNWNTVNTNWRMKYFFLFFINTTVGKFINCNIGAVNGIQNRFVYLHEIGEQIKILFLIKTLLQYIYSYFSFHLPTIQLFISIWEKSYRDIYHFLPYVSVITGNILIMIIRFVRNYVLLASNSTFMTDSMYVGTTQIYKNLN